MIEIVIDGDGFHLRLGGKLVFGPATKGECRAEAARRGKVIAPHVVVPDAPAPEPEPTPEPTPKRRSRKSG